MRPTPRTIMAWIASAVVAATVIAAFAVLGSPREQRARRFDERRRENLRGLAYAIDVHHRTAGRLPDTLAELPTALDPRAEARDPETGAPYEYERLADDRYRLCAIFAREAPPDDEGQRHEFWRHAAGRHCFEVEVERVER